MASKQSNHVDDIMQTGPSEQEGTTTLNLLVKNVHPQMEAKSNRSPRAFRLSDISRERKSGCSYPFPLPSGVPWILEAAHPHSVVLRWPKHHGT